MNPKENPVNPGRKSEREQKAKPNGQDALVPSPIVLAGYEQEAFQYHMAEMRAAEQQIQQLQTGMVEAQNRYRAAQGALSGLVRLIQNRENRHELLVIAADGSALIPTGGTP